MGQRRVQALLWALMIAVGCDQRYPETAKGHSAISTPIGAHFNPATVGRIQGQVLWEGPIPVVPPLEVWSILLSADGARQKWTAPNPHGPRIHEKSRGVGNAVIFLRGVDLQQSKQWDHEPVQVEIKEQQFHVLQGNLDSAYGFVRLGEPIGVVSREPVFYSVHADGAAFFTLAFPDPHDSLTRQLTEKGVVELTSATGRFAMRAYLFVDEHPYYTQTDAQGRFVLEGVPPGKYEVVCWLPNWNKARHERDPETGIISRYYFIKPLETSTTITVPSGESVPVHFKLSQESFGH